MFTSKGFTVAFTFRSAMHFQVTFFLWCETPLQISFLNVETNYLSIIYWNKWFFPLNFHSIFVENQLTIKSRAYFFALNCTPLIHMSVFMPEHYCVHYCSFVVSDEIHFPFQHWFDYSGSLVFPYEFHAI